MKERGIIFTGESVQAILDGRKVMTRRVIKPQPDIVADGKPVRYKQIAVVRDHSIEYVSHPDGEPHKRYCDVIRCPYGQPGDRLWVRETWEMDPNEYGWDEKNRRNFVTHKADCPEDYKPWWGWKSPMFMPRWASRLTLEVVSVKVERLQDISQADAKAEGAEPWFKPGDGMKETERGVEFSIEHCPEDKRDYVTGFKHLWNAINEKRGYGWEMNPWVWCVSFKVVTP